MEVPFQDMVRKVGSLLTAERSSWRMSGVEILPNGEQRVTTGTGWFYEGVTLREIDGTLRLVTTGCPQPHAPTIPDGPEFLLSLINLVKQPIPWDQVAESVSAEDACAWCTQHGLPAVEAIIDQWWPGLSLGFFQRETLTLAILCRVWRALVYQDGDTLARDLPQLWKAWAMQRRGVTDAWRAQTISATRLIAKPSPTEREEFAKKCIEMLLNERMGQVRLEFAWGDPAPHLRLMAPSLFHIGYVQMASLLTKLDAEIKQHLKGCQNCHQLFWGHGNRRYCPRPQCDRRHVHRHKMNGGQTESR